jgi:hypothetical protein
MTGIYEPEQDAGNVEIKDPDDLHRIRRVEAIHDARERFVKVRLQARDMMYDDPNWSQFNVDRYAIMTALDYLREIEPMVRRSDSRLIEHTVTIPSKRFSTEAIPKDGRADRVKFDESSLRTEPVEITLGELLTVGGSTRADATVTGTEVGHVDYRKEIEVTVNAGERVAVNIARLCDDFIEDALPSIGKAADSTADFDYSDLI